MRLNTGLLSMLRHVARHSWLVLCVVGMLGTNIAVMLDRGTPWRGDLVWTIDWLTIGHVLVGPLVAGFAAVDTVRLSIGVRDLPLRGWRNADSAVGLTYGMALAAVHLVFVSVIIAVSAPPRFDAAAALAVLTQIAILWFFVGLGVLIGRFAPPILGGIAAAILGLVCVYMFTDPRSPTGLLYGGAATVPRMGYSYSAAWLGIQLAAILTMLAAMWLVRPAWGRSRLRLAALSALGLLLAAGASQVFAAAPGERLSASVRGPESCGSLAGVPWCYFPEHERVIGGYANHLLALFDAAQVNGYEGFVPDAVEEASQTTWPGDANTGPFYVTSDALAGTPPTLWEVTINLVQPLHCKQLQAEQAPADQYWEDLYAVTATWTNMVDPSAAEQAGYFGESLDPSDAERIMEKFRTCTYAFE